MFALDDRPASDLDALPGLFDALTDGTQPGAVFRGVLPDHIGEAVITASQGTMNSHGPDGEGPVCGPALILAPPDLRDYLAAADTLAGFRAGGLDLENVFRTVLARIANGRTVERARHPDGRPYAPIGLRRLDPGRTIALHCENETRALGSMQGLVPQLDPRTLVSVYAPLVLPDGGGAHEVYPLRHGEGAARVLLDLDRRGDRLEDFLARHPPAVSGARVGDVLVFDAGRYYHRVTAVTGARSRYTLGAFASLSRDGTRVLYWN